MKKSISLWTRYTELGASSRLRFCQFIPYLQKYGYKTDLHPFFDEIYLKKLYSGQGKSTAALCKSLLTRIRELKKIPADAPMFIEYELLPYLPFCVEKKFLEKRKYILNFDDSVDLRYQHIPFLKNKYPALIKNAAGIVTANSHLTERFSVYNDNIIQIPTVPPPMPEMPEVEKFEKLTLCWIGTPVTYEYLKQHTEILQKMYNAVPFELLVIASAALPPVEGIPTRRVDWSSETEAELLKRSHIGIMPLPDTPFARGKSSFKLIQYLSANIPAIASPVGENKIVLRHKETGFSASSADEWVYALQELATAEKRDRFREAIIAEAEKYSLTNAASVLSDFFDRTLF